MNSPNTNNSHTTRRSRSRRRATVALAVAFACAVSAATTALGAEASPQTAKFSLAQARPIALKAQPGKITDEELETERGGSGLRYSFDIKNRHTTYEVGVDAITGKVLENRPESAKPD